AGNRPPGAVHDAERPITLVDAAHDDPEAENVGELAEREVLALHLAPDRIRPFLAAKDPRVDAVFGKLADQSLLDLDQHLAAFLMKLGKPLSDRLERVGIEHAE